MLNPVVKLLLIIAGGAFFFIINRYVDYRREMKRRKHVREIITEMKKESL